MSTRRDFIKCAGLSGVAAVALPNLADSFLDNSVSFDKQKISVLFQGDSITDGNRSRNNDWNHVLGHGYAYLLASRLLFDNIGKNYMFYNRGISGNKVSDLYNRWIADAIDLKPDLISILVGINDVNAFVYGDAEATIENFESCYRQLLDCTKNSLPDTKLVLCEPFFFPFGRASVKTEVWKEQVKLRQDILRKLVKDYSTYFVPLQKPFDDACTKAPQEYWVWDGIHPMPAGHELIAREWLKVFNKIEFK
jgi:lysophospholipase L1-like esterase